MITIKDTPAGGEEIRICQNIVTFSEKETIRAFQRIFIDFLKELDQKNSFLTGFSQKEGDIWYFSLDHQCKPVTIEFLLEGNTVVVKWFSYSFKNFGPDTKAGLAFCGRESFFKKCELDTTFGLSSMNLFSSLALCYLRVKM